MANELGITATLNCTKGSYAQQKVRSYSATFNGTHTSAGVQSIPTTAGGTAIVIAAAVATAGQAWFVNLDITNYLTIGTKPAGTFSPCIKIKPGEVAMFRLSTTTLYALADTAACDLEFLVMED